MNTPSVTPLDVEIDAEGEKLFLEYKKNHPEDDDLQPLRIIEDFKVSKTLELSLNKLTEEDVTVELDVFYFKDDKKHNTLKPCICLVTGKTDLKIEFVIAQPTVARLKACYLSAVKGYDPGNIQFEEKDSGKPTNEFGVSVLTKPLFKPVPESGLHWPCYFGKRVEDNDDFKLMNLDLNQSRDNVCVMTLTYKLYNTQIIKYCPDYVFKCSSTLAKLNEFVPTDSDTVTITLETNKFYQCYDYYSNKLRLLSASYGEK